MGRLKNRHVKETETAGAPRPTTLGDLYVQGLKVFCWCNRCTHNAQLDPEPLCRRLGPQLPVPEAGARMRCSSCGSKDIATRPAWPSLGQVTRHNE